jgi:hypothetical protein
MKGRKEGRKEDRKEGRKDGRKGNEHLSRTDGRKWKEAWPGNGNKEVSK